MISKLANLFCLGSLVLSAARISAQALPTDSDQWRERCANLVQSGGVPNPDPSGIPAARMEQLARERSARGQHFVACSLFMSAAGGNAVRGNAQQTREDISLAKVEQKLALGQKLSFVDKLTRSSDVFATASQQALPANPNEMMAIAMMVQPGGAMMAPGAYPPPAQYPQQGAYLPSQAEYGAPVTPSPYGAAAGPSSYGAPVAQISYSAAQAQYPAPSGQYPQPAQAPPAPPVFPAAQGQYSPPGAVSQGQYNMPGPGSYSSAAPVQNPGAPPIASPVGQGGFAVAAGTPAVSAPAMPVSAASGAPPVGHYGCSSAPVMITVGGAYGTNIHQLGQWQGDIWILNGQQYAGPYHKDDVGNYVMNGNTLVAQSGSYAPPRNSTQITLTPAQGNSAAVLSIVFLDNGKPSIGTNCVWKESQ